MVGLSYLSPIFAKLALKRKSINNERYDTKMV